jgi:hypothetical protein
LHTPVILFNYKKEKEKGKRNEKERFFSVL